MINRLKKIDRTLLELFTGIGIFAVVCELAGLFFPMNQGKYAIGLWAGILISFFSAYHMWHSLNKAFLCDEKSAARLLSGGYILRYLITGGVLVLLYYTDAGYFLACFLGVLGLKMAAYLEPLTHKFYNYIFHEEDPIPQPLTEEE